MSTAAAPAAGGSTSAPADAAFKLFVGNLPFAFTDAELRTAFAFYNPASANIIIGGQSKRSRGYGFVDLRSQTDVENAIREMNSKEVGGRRLNVEAARFRPAQTGAGGSGSSSSSSSSSYPAAGSAGGSGGGGPHREGGRYMPRRRFHRDPRDSRDSRDSRPGNGSGSSSSAAAPGSTATTTTTTSSGGPRGPRDSHESHDSHDPRQSFPRRRFTRRPRSDAADKAARPPSTDTVFVSNLPFSTTDDGLRTIFHGLNIKEARVVRRYGRSRGYGFVAFNTTTDREAALKFSNNVVEGRTISVQVAMQQPPRPPPTTATTGAPGPATPVLPAAK